MAATTAARVDAQCANAPRRPAALPVVGSAADDSLRLGSLVAWCNADGSMIRSALSLRPRPGADSALRIVVLDPGARTVWNSDLPNSRNDGVLWAGRGLNYEVTAGVAASWRNFEIVVDPVLTHSENQLFDIIPSSANPGNFKVAAMHDPNVSPFASPWHTGVYDADLPLRFGSLSFRRVDLGESWVSMRVRSFVAGFSNATQWWGPGVENALVMSNNAGGIPHFFVRSAAPMPTKLGDVEWLAMAGVLTESPFFDREQANDRRSLTAGVVTLRVAADTGLTLGLERSVYSELSLLRRLPTHFTDIVRYWHPDSGETDQLTGAFARWVFPASGLAAYGEWMLLAMPSSLRDFLVAPGNGQGYTIGFEWARPIGRSTFGIQAEATTLEQTPSASGVEWPDFYTSRRVHQGYTQRGQVIGAAIGPGASSQSARFTFLRGPVNLAASLARIRWEDGAYYRSPAGFNYRSHDVSLEAGATLRVDTRYAGAEIGFARSLRKNYLFQTPNPFLFESAFDHRNTMIVTRIAPHLRGLGFGTRH
jgi:hypothetical protein